MKKKTNAVFHKTLENWGHVLHSYLQLLFLEIAGVTDYSHLLTFANDNIAKLNKINLKILNQLLSMSLYKCQPNSYVSTIQGDHLFIHSCAFPTRHQALCCGHTVK